MHVKLQMLHTVITVVFGWKFLNQYAFLGIPATPENSFTLASYQGID